jgi:hypothetical protein
MNRPGFTAWAILFVPDAKNQATVSGTVIDRLPISREIGDNPYHGT